MNLKRLEPEAWVTMYFKWPNLGCYPEMQECRVFVGKDGWYYHRHTDYSWVEYEGKAVTWDSAESSFREILNILNVVPLCMKQQEQIRTVLNHLPKEYKHSGDALREILINNYQWWNLRTIRRDIRKNLKR